MNNCLIQFIEKYIYIYARLSIANKLCKRFKISLKNKNQNQNQNQQGQLTKKLTLDLKNNYGLYW
jgi:ribosome-binding protein aMBF1 (putative translation factor)